MALALALGTTVLERGNAIVQCVEACFFQTSSGPFDIRSTCGSTPETKSRGRCL